MATKRRLPRLKTGRKNLDDLFEAWASAIEQALCVSAAAPLETRSGPQGTTIRLRQSRTVKAKLTSGGTGGKYAWTEQYRKPDHTYANLPGGLSGTTTTNPAYEINGFATVPLPKIVDLELSDDNGDYLFQRGSC